MTKMRVREKSSRVRRKTTRKKNLIGKKGNRNEGTGMVHKTCLQNPSPCTGGFRKTFNTIP